MYYSFSGKTANEVWITAINEIIKNKEIKIPSRDGETIELLHTFIHVEDPTQRWVTQRFPPLSIGFALAELIWILAGSNDARIINFWNPVLPKFSGKSNIYHGAYGYRIRQNFDFDQLQQAYLTLKNNADSRQTVISIWDPRIDFPDKLGQPVDNDIPCNICSLLKVRDKKLEWTQIMRSNDIFLGLPYNFIQFTSLQEILAGWLNIGIGSYSHFSDSLHLYHRDLSKINIANDKKYRNTDSLLVEKDECDFNVDLIYRNMVELTTKDVSEGKIEKLAELGTKNEAYSNIMYIIAMYVANKNGYTSLVQNLEQKCSNELYKDLWCSWKEVINHV